MAVYRAGVEWSLKEGEDFPSGRYSRGHGVDFTGGHHVPGTASPHVVGNKWAVAGSVDPEEMLVASIASCHMLSFLHVARLAGLSVVYYRDAAEGVMEEIEPGRLAVTRVTLRPEIAYSGARPDDTQRDALHHAAHDACFIANSVKTQITVEERAPVAP